MFLARSMGMKVFASAVLVLLCIGSYHNSLRNEFAFDDYLAIVNNVDVMYGSNGTSHLSEYAKLWSKDIWGKEMSAHDSHRSYRPLLVTVFKLIVHISGLSARVFRMVSISFHSAATVGVFYLSSMIFGNECLAFGAAIMFACHPVHVESVAAVVNMAEAVSLTLSIIAFCIFYKSSKVLPNVSKSRPGTPAQTTSPLYMQLLSITLWFSILALSVLFKETGITICGIIVAASGTALLLTMKTSYLTKRVTTRNSKASKSNILLEIVLQSLLRWSKTNVSWLVAALSGVFCYSLFRVSLLIPKGASYQMPFKSLFSFFDYTVWRGIKESIGKSYLGESKLIRKAENPFSFLRGTEKTLSMMYLHFRYFYQLLWPDSLCAEYAFDCIPKVSSVRDPRFLLVVLFYSFIVSSFFYFLYRVLVPSSLEVRMVLDYGGEEKDVVEGQGKGKYGGKKKERSCAVWKVLPEHYLLSLVWMIVPFIPASGKISFAHTCLVLSSRSSLLYLYLALYLFLHFCLHPPHSLFFF
jgi:Domain of unknown function (DUF1736)